MDDFKNKFKNDSNFKELQYLKEVHSDVIMGGCKLSKNMLDAKGNRSSGWPDGEMRGNKPYYSPKGWIGIGLKVEDRFDQILLRALLKKYMRAALNQGMLKHINIVIILINQEQKLMLEFIALLKLMLLVVILGNLL